MKLQRDIDRLGNWARKRVMRFQTVKCNMMQLTRKHLNKIQASYTLEGTALENVDNIKYLGVTITNDLKWNTHIRNICTNANRTLGFLRRTKPGYLQMTLFPRLGVAEISIPWPFRFPLPIKMSIKIASSPRLSGTGMTSLNL